MNRGYSGYYNGVYLRSSYEYAYAKYLDYQNIEWRYEDQEFNLLDGTYLPDFFVYKNGELQFIAEVKSGEKREIQRAIIRLNELKKQFQIESKLILFKDLKELYKDMPFKLHKVIQEWINSEATKINKSVSGELNPHFGISHSIQTKKLISKNSIERWSDQESRNYMIKRLRESAQIISQKLKGRIKVKREIRQCLSCGKSFETLITSNQKSCSQYCAGVINFQKGNHIYVNGRIGLHNEIKTFVVDWCKQNPGIILETPYNRITTMLSPLFNQIQENFNVKDMRVISKAVFGEDKGRKELLKFLKAVASEKVC